MHGQGYAHPRTRANDSTPSGRKGGYGNSEALSDVIDGRWRRSYIMAGLLIDLSHCQVAKLLLINYSFVLVG